MTELRFYKHPVVDCGDFDKFVREVYGKEYSVVNSLGDRLEGHFTYQEIDMEEWRWEKKQDWYDEDDYGYSVSFEDWMKKDYPACYNDGPQPEVMIEQLQKDGYDVPNRFMMLVDW